ncbi:MAG: hypothetical protein HY875_11115 [Chloroflexi bacterium]|nr:hypothetical protein [Chloroflexota bacterium]
MTVKYLRDQRHQGTVAEIANSRFPFPSADHPDMETVVNVPTHRMSVGKVLGKDFFPDIVVVGRPGQWLRMMVQVETADSVTEDSAMTRWLPCSEFGDLFVYVPAGYADAAKKLCKKHKIRVKGIRTWRFQPVWGLAVAQA